MSCFVLVLALIITTLALPAGAATLTGSFTYDGQPVSEVLPDLTHGVILAHNTDTSESVWATVDPSLGTYEVADLSAGPWFIQLLLSDEDPGERILLLGGEAYAYDSVEIANEPDIILDLELGYGYVITQPFDGPWPGSIVECPEGAGLPAQFTFAWEPVPRAVRYEVTMGHVGCDGGQEVNSIETEETSVEILQGTVANEDYLVIFVRAYSAGGAILTSRPYVDYDDGTTQAALSYLEEGSRPSHPMGSVFVPQVARLPGVGDSFWTSDVVLTNPLSTDVNATLVYTERGANGLVDYTSETVPIPAGGCRVLADIVGGLFQSSGAGWLEVSPSSLGVTSRISTPGLAGGSYGQGFPALTADDAASVDGPVKALGAGGVERGAFRTNLILTEIWGEAVEVRMTVLDRDGEAIGAANVALDPFSTKQINDVVDRVGGPAALTEGQVVVEATGGTGRVVGALSVVDEVTGDPTTLALEPR